MKHSVKKVLCILLTFALLIPSVFFLAVSAEVSAFQGQQVLPVYQVEIPVVQDGIIDGAEYGTESPTIRLTPGNGFWAEDAKGKVTTENLPAYIDLFLARKGEKLFVGIRVPEQAHSNKLYYLDTFLGFGDDTTSYTMNSGTITGFTMSERTQTNTRTDTWMDFQPTSFSSQIFDANGNKSAGNRLYSSLIKWPCPRWAKIPTKANPHTIYEVELNIEDAVVGSGKTFTSVPDNGFFGFDLALFNGNTAAGKLHANLNLGSEKSVSEANPAASVPHILDLSGNAEINLDDRNAKLSSLELAMGSLTPSFDPSVTSYTANVPYGEVIDITAIAEASTSTVAVEGQDALGTSNEGKVTVGVTAKNGYCIDYTINVVRDYVSMEYTASTNEELQTVFQDLQSEEWSDEKSPSILLEGDFTNDSDVLLSLPTLFTQSGKKVPIILEGRGVSTLTLSAKRIASANDFIFRNLTLDIPSDADFFAGAGNVVFENVTFANRGTGFWADNYTEKVLIGWDEDNLAKAMANKKFTSSLTFKGDTVYTPVSATPLIGAVGFGEEAWENDASVTLSLLPKDTTAEVIIDGATLSRVGARVGVSPVSTALVTMKRGSVQALWGDSGTKVAGEYEEYPGSIKISVSGGEIGQEGLRGLNFANLKGSLSINVSQASDLNPTVISHLYTTYYGEVNGSANLTISGGTVKGDVAGGSAVLKTATTIEGATISGSFYGIRTGATRIIANTVKDTVIKGSFYGGHYSSGAIRGITNSVSQVTVNGAYVGGSAAGMVNGNITNNLKESTISGASFGGSASGTVKGNIVNAIDTTKFAGAFSGGANGIVTGNVTNSVTGSSNFTATFYGGCAQSSNTVEIRGSITNRIYPSVTGHAPTFAAISGGVAYYGGPYNGNVGKGIVNIISGGNFTNRITGGTMSGSIINPNSQGFAVQNTISGGIFQGAENPLGTLAGKANGKIKNTISGGEFSGDIGFIMRGGEVTGETISTITGGTFHGSLYATRGLTGSQYLLGAFSPSLTISGGEFMADIYAGGYDAGSSTVSTPITGTASITITGGTIHGSVYAGSKTRTDNTGVVMLKPVDGDIYIGGTAEARSASETVTVEKGTYDLVIGSTPLAYKLDEKKLSALPIANSTMTPDQLRQLCMDYFELQLSFTWTPNMSITHLTKNYVAGSRKNIDVGVQFAGVPYQTIGTGNLYRWMEYHNSETGVFDMKNALAENGGYGTSGKANPTNGQIVFKYQTDANGNETDTIEKISAIPYYYSLRYFFNQCSVASFWGWARVINSANFYWTNEMNVYNGFIPVGLYTYGYEYEGRQITAETIARWGQVNADVVDENGKITTYGWNPLGYNQKDAMDDLTGRVWNGSRIASYDSAKLQSMYEKFALVKGADALIQPGHAMMAKECHVVRNEDGSINGDESYLIVMDQGEGWAVGDRKTGVTKELTDLYGNLQLDKNGNTVPWKVTEFSPASVYGMDYYKQGNTAKKYTFKSLVDDSTLPLTFAEFQDTNPQTNANWAQDAAHLNFYNSLAKNPMARCYTAEKVAGLATTAVGTLPQVAQSFDLRKTGAGVEKAEAHFALSGAASDYTTSSITFANLKNAYVYSNYAISDIFIEMIDSKGNVLKTKVWRTLEEPNVRLVGNFAKMVDSTRSYFTTGLDSYTGKQIKISAQLGNGEKLVVYSGTLTA